jgi:hypothetical protein
MARIFESLGILSFEDFHESLEKMKFVAPKDHDPFDPDSTPDANHFVYSVSQSKSYPLASTLLFGWLSRTWGTP